MLRGDAGSIIPVCFFILNRSGSDIVDGWRPVNGDAAVFQLLARSDVAALHSSFNTFLAEAEQIRAIPEVPLGYFERRFRL